jgi:hypothetical protein
VRARRKSAPANVTKLECSAFASLSLSLFLSPLLRTFIATDVRAMTSAPLAVRHLLFLLPFNDPARDRGRHGTQRCGSQISVSYHARVHRFRWRLEETTVNGRALPSSGVGTRVLDGLSVGHEADEQA